MRSDGRGVNRPIIIGTTAAVLWRRRCRGRNRRVLTWPRRPRDGHLQDKRASSAYAASCAVCTPEYIARREALYRVSVLKARRA